LPSRFSSASCRSGTSSTWDKAAQAGQIEVETPASAYFRSGTFSTEDIIAFWGQGIDKDTGTFGFIRATGEMPSVLDHPHSRKEFFRFEAMLNQFCRPGSSRQGGGVRWPARERHAS
jgi:hypothetical protein